MTRSEIEALPLETTMYDESAGEQRRLLNQREALKQSHG